MIHKVVPLPGEGKHGRNQVGQRQIDGLGQKAVWFSTATDGGLFRREAVQSPQCFTFIIAVGTSEAPAANKIIASDASGRRSKTFNAGNTAIAQGNSNMMLKAFAAVISAAARLEFQRSDVFCSRRARRAYSNAASTSSAPNMSFTTLPACRT